MKTHPTPSLLALAAIAALMAAPALAQDGGYYYGGLGIGQARARVDDAAIAASLLGGSLATSAGTHNEHPTAYKVFGGYQFNRNLGVELGYFHLGTYDFAASTVPAGTLGGDFRVQGANLDLVGTMPFTDRLSGLARVGAQYARTRTSINGTGAVVVGSNGPSDRETNAKYGLGLQYAFSPSFLVRGEAERFRVSDALGNHPQVTMYSMSLVFPFGRSEAPMRRAMAAPVYVAQAPVVVPPPAPMVVAPIPPAVPVAAFAPPQIRRVTYSSESLFGFDRAELRPEGMAALDTFARELRGTTFDTITVQGHADRIGGTAYNQTLSLERAEAVKAYLVKTAGLDPARVVASGRGETEPVTAADACKGGVNEQLKACLQPDRRVEIEVSGTR